MAEFVAHGADAVALAALGFHVVTFLVLDGIAFVVVGIAVAHEFRAAGVGIHQYTVEGQLTLFDGFNEAEVLSKPDAPEPEITEIVISSYKRNKTKGKRDEDLDGLPARIIEHTLTKEELSEKFPEGYKELPPEIYKRLHIIPETFIVDEHHVHVYASKSNNGVIIKAPRSVDLFRNSIATPSLIASIINGKYVNALPLERQSRAFKCNGVNLSTNTMANWVINSATSYLSLVYDHMQKLIYSSKVIHADETPVKVMRIEGEKLKNGKKKERKVTGQLKQYIIVTFSRKMMEYQRHIRSGQIERAKELLKTKDPEMIKKGPNDVTRFIKRKSTGKNGEEATDSYYVDQSIIEEEEKYDGYYAIATNLNCKKHEDAVKILDISAGRNKIEDCFRVLKTNFSARPAYVSERNHIIGHFITCYTALLVYRLLETKLDQAGTHFTTDQILETLKVMNVMNFQDTFYASTYTESEVGIALNAAFDLGLNKKYYQPKELNKKLKNILK